MGADSAVLSTRRSHHIQGCAVAVVVKDIFKLSNGLAGTVCSIMDVSPLATHMPLREIMNLTVVTTEGMYPLWVM